MRVYIRMAGERAILKKNFLNVLKYEASHCRAI